jgi:nucleotide-binding universal stress UspA family protein
MSFARSLAYRRLAPHPFVEAEIMMRNILVPLFSECSGEPALEASLTLAKRMNSHIRAMFIRPNPDAAMRYIPEMVIAGGIDRESIEKEGHQAAETEKARFNAWRAKHELAAEPADNRLDSRFASWREQVGEIEQIVTHFGRVSDLIAMSRFETNNVTAARCFDAAVFGTGRPTLIVPKKVPWDLLDHVMIAWNGSLEASHAVFGALPLLHAAQLVTIFNVPETDSDEPGGTELAEALSWYGISARRVGRVEPASSTGAALLTAAHHCKATLIVMGAYTHSRLQQTFLGGVTRRVLSEATIPVLMSH